MNEIFKSIGVIEGETFNFASGQNAKVVIPDYLVSDFRFYNGQRVVMRWESSSADFYQRSLVRARSVELESQSDFKPTLPDIELFVAIPNWNSISFRPPSRCLNINILDKNKKSIWQHGYSPAQSAIIIGRQHSDGNGRFDWMEVLDFEFNSAHIKPVAALSTLLGTRKQSVLQKSGYISGDYLIESDDQKQLIPCLLLTPELRLQWKTLDDGKSTVMMTYSKIILEDGSIAHMVYSVEQCRSDSVSESVSDTDTDTYVSMDHCCGFLF